MSRGLVVGAAQPDEARERAVPGEVGVVLALLLVPRADEQQYELGMRSATARGSFQLRAWRALTRRVAPVAA